MIVAAIDLLSSETPWATSLPERHAAPLARRRDPAPLAFIPAGPLAAPAVGYDDDDEADIDDEELFDDEDEEFDEFEEEDFEEEEDDGLGDEDEFDGDEDDEDEEL